jgi:DNA-binding NarL/FixJ family response regulator
VTVAGTVRLVVADDHQVVRDGFAELLNTQPDFTVIATASHGSEAVRIRNQLHLDVVLMDIRTPGVDGIEATRQLVRSTSEGPRILTLTTFDLDEFVYKSLRAGANGFLLKDGTAERLFDAVRVIAAGDALLAPSITRHLISKFAARRQPSSPNVGAEGLSNHEIAQRLVVSEETVKTHLSRVLNKLGLRDRTQPVITVSGLCVCKRQPKSTTNGGGA